MVRSRKTMKVNAPADIIKNLRYKFPGMQDSDLIRMTYNFSAVRAEIKLEKIDFKNKLGSFLYGKKNWKKQYDKGKSKVKKK